MMHTTSVTKQPDCSLNSADMASPPIEQMLSTREPRQRIRFLLISGFSFVMTLLALGIVDPEVLFAAGLADAALLQSFLSRAMSSLQHLDMLGVVCVAGASMAVFALLVIIGYLNHPRNSSVEDLDC